MAEKVNTLNEKKILILTVPEVVHAVEWKRSYVIIIFYCHVVMHCVCQW